MREIKCQRTEIWSLNAVSIAFLWTFCAAVSKPDSAVHSSGVSTTPWTTSIPFRPVFFASAWRSLSTRSCTVGDEHRRWTSDPASGRDGAVPGAGGATARMADFRLVACGKTIAMGCLACEVACTQRLETSEDVRYVASSCSRATYWKEERGRVSIANLARWTTWRFTYLSAFKLDQVLNSRIDV